MQIRGQRERANERRPILNPAAQSRRWGPDMRITRLLAIAALGSAYIVGVASPAGAAEVMCDADPSSSDIQAVIDANPPGTTIQLAEDCTYSVTATIRLRDGDSLLGATSSTAPETFLAGSGQTIDCIGHTDPLGIEDATGIDIQTLDISGCMDGIQVNHGWEVGGPGALTVWSHDNNNGLNMGTIADPALDIKVHNVRLYGNDLMGLRGAMSDTAAGVRTTIAFSEIFANGDGGEGGVECTPTSNCAGSKFLGGYAGPGGVSPLVCGNVVYGNLGLGHGLWVDVTADDIGAFGRGLLFAGNIVRDNEGQGFRIERSDSHRIGNDGNVNCVGTTLEATNVIDDNGTPFGSCVAVWMSEYTQVTDNECNVLDHASAVGGGVIQIHWRPRDDIDVDGDGDILCELADPDDCQKTTHNIVKDNTVRFRASTEAVTTSVGFAVPVTGAYPGMWLANDFTANDYCVTTTVSTEIAADHFSWTNSTGVGIDPQPWSAQGAGNDWRDNPVPRYDEEKGASFSRTCPNKN